MNTAINLFFTAMIYTVVILFCACLFEYDCNSIFFVVLLVGFSSVIAFIIAVDFLEGVTA